MKIDLTCPVELWQYSTPKEDEPECTFVLNNLSDKVVTSVQVTLVCRDREDKLLFRQSERIQGLAAGVGERFSIMLLPTQWQDMAGAELIIEKVWFDDATIWRRGNAPMTEYQPNALPMGRRLDQLRFVAGQDAVGYPEEQPHVWMCVCGRPNPKSNTRCCRCGRRAEAIFASYQRQNVDQLIAVHEQKLSAIAQKAREDASKLAEERELANRQKKFRRRLILRISLGAVLAAGLIMAAFLWVIPALRYRQAEALLAEGKYEEARAAFAAMGEFWDAAEMQNRSHYLEAKAWLSAGDLSSLRKASDTFWTMRDYEDSESLWRQACYQTGEQELAAGNYDAAAEAFQQLGAYQDSEEKLKEATYRQAEQLFAGASYAASQVLFEGLGSYKDSAGRAQASEYERGKAAQASGDYAQAILHFEAVGDYEDAAERLQAVCYAQAEARMLEGAYEEAGLLYQRAGDYQDASIKANDSLYQRAQERMLAKDYVKAAELFGLIAPYLDSESQGWECVYQQGEEAVASGRYSEAQGFFASISQYRDASARSQECQYLLAQEQIGKGRLAEAVTLLEGLGDYLDSAKLLNETRYQWAGQFMAEGNYEQAAQLYEVLGSYLDSAAQVKQCEYQLAQNALANQDYAAAVEGFAALGKYEDAAEKLAAATYELAMQQKESGDLQNAAALLSSLPQDSDAKAQLAEITYEEAMKEKNQGHLEEAAALFLALGDFQDAAQQGRECFQQVYGGVAEPAREAFAEKDYPAVIQALDGLGLENLPQEYKDLADIYNQACYAYAEELYQGGKPYEALPYYQRIPTYRDVGDRKLERRCYLILGTWESSTGKIAEFRPDGTCNIAGEESLFWVDSYSVLTGQTAETLTLTHKLTSITREGMTLREVAEGRSLIYKFTRVSGPAGGDPTGSGLAPGVASPPAEPPLSQEDENSMLVREDEP